MRIGTMAFLLGLASGGGALASPPAPFLVHGFRNCPDGAHSFGGLAPLNGVLYGTTYNGGLCSGVEGENGAIFAVNPGSLDEQVVYRFSSTGTGPSNPRGTLLPVGTLLYGTTYGEGGSLFSFDPGTKALTTLAVFGARLVGANPWGTLTQVGNVIVGANSNGGPYQSGNRNGGSVFAFDTASGQLSILHYFGGPGDGDQPLSPVYTNGALYGMTVRGGLRGGGGVIYQIDPATGTTDKAYQFDVTPPKPSFPAGTLVSANGLLYGVTQEGGAFGEGTIFSFDPTARVVRTVHSFGGADDGARPEAGMVPCGAYLCGTTAYLSHAPKKAPAQSESVVYQFDPATGAETVLATIDRQLGKAVASPLLDYDGFLWGTSSDGGASRKNGAVFGLPFP